jgi:hypothetical protein
LADSFIHSHFCYKAGHAEELADAKADRPLRVRVEKVIELTQRQYQYFSTHLLEDMPFIAANRKLAGRDPQGVTHCLLVTTRNDWGGILVDCQGYDYARYAAEVRNKSALDLRDVPIDHYEPKPRQPHDRQEQR